MLNFGPTFIWAAINLIILYIFMRKYLFNRVTDFMEKRQNMITESLKTAQDNKLESELLKEKYEKQLTTAKNEAERIIAEAIKKGNNEYDELINLAKADSSSMLSKAREQIERERAAMIKQVKNEIASIALAAATKVLQENMNTDKNKKIVDKFIDEVGVA